MMKTRVAQEDVSSKKLGGSGISKDIENIRFRIVELDNIKISPLNKAFDSLSSRLSYLGTTIQEIQNSEGRLADILNSLPDATLAIDNHGKIICWNYAMEVMTGIRADRMLGKGDFEYSIPFYSERRPMLIDLVLDFDESLRDRYTDLRRQGEILSGEAYTPNLKSSRSPHIYATASVLRNSKGEIIGAIESFRDNTERKELERKLIQSERKYRNLVDNHPIGVFQTNLQGEILFANKAFVEIFEYESAEELLSANITGMYKSNKDRVEFIQALIDTGRLNQHEIELITKKGKPRTLVLNAILEDGVITVTIRDITVRKRVQEDNAKLHSQLLQAQKMQAVGTLAGGIAHDFNNLLMGIRGNIDLLLNNFPSDDPCYLRLKRIDDLINSGAGLTRQLLGFARGGKCEVMPANVNDIIEKCISLFSPINKAIEICKHYVDPVWITEVDRVQIEQVFMNIFINAGQAMPKSGILFVETCNIGNPSSEGPFVIAPGKYVRISVKDTGIGMDEKTIERIFDPFFTTKSPGRGTGLGLASAYGIIKNHGGYILANSESGRGSTFTVYLPAREGRITSKRVPRENVLVSGTETILVVDDEIMIVELAKDMLETMGYRVLAAGSGSEAVAVFSEKKEKIDLVILDMIMPGMSGESTIKALQGMNSKVRIILASGYGIDDQIQPLMETACIGFLQKPFKMHELSIKVREILNSNEITEQRSSI